jgi:hypothetical protein
MKWLFFSLVILSCLLSVGNIRAQDERIPLDHITLDSVTITAVREGLDIEDLIQIMQYDSTLYIAFNNLHFTAYEYDLVLKAFNKKRRQVASKEEIIRQTWDGSCREQFIDSSYAEGDFKNRKGREKYYTVELFNRTFYSDRRTCNEKRKSNYKDIVYGSKEEGHIGAIKRVVFNPGSPVKLPIIGKKFGLFRPSLMEYYDYSIQSKNIQGYDCYEFTIAVKPEFADHPKEVIVRKLTTAFNKKDFQVIKRDYYLYYKGAMVKADIKMDIILSKKGDRYFPDYFTYDGKWNVPAKKPEHVHMITYFDH